jgi:hypothetical protein
MRKKMQSCIHHPRRTDNNRFDTETPGIKALAAPFPGTQNPSRTSSVAFRTLRLTIPNTY